MYIPAVTMFRVKRSAKRAKRKNSRNVDIFASGSLKHTGSAPPKPKRNKQIHPERFTFRPPVSPETQQLPRSMLTKNLIASAGKA